MLPIRGEFINQGCGFVLVLFLPMFKLQRKGATHIRQGLSRPVVGQKSCCYQKGLGKALRQTLALNPKP